MAETTNDLEWLPADADGRYLQRIDVQFHSSGRVYSYAWGGQETW